MKEKLPADCAEMSDVRVEIDELDRQLVDLVAERFSYVDRAWQLKNNPEDSVVPWRIDEVIQKVRARANEKGIPPELAESVWRQMIGWFIQFEEEKLRAKKNDQNTS